MDNYDESLRLPLLSGERIWMNLHLPPLNDAKQAHLSRQFH